MVEDAARIAAVVVFAAAALVELKQKQLALLEVDSRLATPKGALSTSWYFQLLAVRKTSQYLYQVRNLLKRHYYSPQADG